MSVLTLCLLAAAVCGCDSDAARAEMAPGGTLAKTSVNVDASITTADLGERPILAQPIARPDAKRAAPVFKHYGVNPTIDTSEQSSSSFSVDLDTASYELAASSLGRNRLPPAAAVRVEEFLQALVPAPTKASRGRAVSIDVASTISIQRPGYQVLRISIDASPAPARPLDVILAVDQSPGMQERAQAKATRALAAAIVDKLAPGDRIAVVRLGPKVELGLDLSGGKESDARKKQVLAALKAKPDTTSETKAGAKGGAKKDLKLRDVFNLLDKTDRSRHVVYIGTGVLDGHEAPAARDLVDVATAASNRGVTTSVLGIGPAPYDDVTLERIGSAGRGAYRFAADPARSGAAFVADAKRPIVAVDGKVMVRFAPEAVIRYRLIGYENRSTSRPGAGVMTRRSGLRAGRSVTALYEVKVSDPTKSWGSVEFGYAPADGGAAKRISKALNRLPTDVNFADTDPRSAIAMVAAAMAEKLRGSYWSRTLSWEDIISLYGTLPPASVGSPGVAELGRLLDAAKTADARSDQYESKTPRADMDFDKLPVIE